MRNFERCVNCFEEYYDVSDRRFFSQTNSCKDCEVQLCIRDRTSSFFLSNDSGRVLSHVIKLIAQGKIIAVKGIGGYLLLCDANNAKTIQLLRARKHRRPNHLQFYTVCYRYPERLLH